LQPASKQTAIPKMARRIHRQFSRPRDGRGALRDNLRLQRTIDA
jgi:hypothetical protein